MKTYNTIKKLLRSLLRSLLEDPYYNYLYTNYIDYLLDLILLLSNICLLGAIMYTVRSM